MARRLSGSIRDLDGRFEASVPERRGVKQRVYAYFTTRAEAERWCADAVAALYAGEPVPIPPSSGPATAPAAGQTGGGVDRHFAVRAAWRWHDETYGRLRTAGPDRANKVKDALVLHVLPYFTGAVTRPDEYTREVAVMFLLRLAGSRDAHYSVSEVAAIAGVSEQRICRMIDRGELTVAGVNKARQRLVRLGDVETALGVPRLRAGYAPSYIKELFSVWKKIEAYLTAEGVLDRAVTDNLRVPKVDPAARIRPPRSKTECVPLEEVREVAQRLHIIHQLALWLLRICGLRISEAFGIKVGDIISMGSNDEPGIVAVERQAGRAFLFYDDNGNVVSELHKKSLKTLGSVRVLMVPQALMALIALVIKVFHTDPVTGEINLDNWLIPALRDAGPGRQHSFRAALRTALGGAMAAGDIESMFVPHDMRSALITDLAYSEVHELLRRRFAGHGVGSDVHSSYIRDQRDNTRFREVAQAIQASITDKVGSLIVATSVFPLFGRSHPVREHLDEVRSQLIEAGALLEALDGDESLLDAAEVALELGCHESHARRMMRSGILPTDDSTGQHRVASADLEAFRAARLPNLRDIAERHQVDYHRLYRLLGDLQLELERDPVTGDFAIGERAEAELLAEVQRVDALRSRACTVVEAARRLRKADSTVRQMLRRGELEVDPETDSSGARFIPHAAIDRYLAEAGRQ